MSKPLKNALNVLDHIQSNLVNNDDLEPAFHQLRVCIQLADLSSRKAMRDLRNDKEAAENIVECLIGFVASYYQMDSFDEQQVINEDADELFVDLVDRGYGKVIKKAFGDDDDCA